MRRLSKVAALLAAASMLFAGGAVAHADEGASTTPQEATPQTLQTTPRAAANDDEAKWNAVKITGATVEDVGAHSAGLKLTYTVDPAYKDQIKSICPVVDVYDISRFKYDGPQGAKLMWASGGFGWDSPCEGIKDPDVTPSDYQRIFGEQTYTATYNDGLSLTQTGHYWNRFIQDAWDTEKRPTSGTFDMTLIGLEPNHFYGNRNTTPNISIDDVMLQWAGANQDKIGQTVDVDIHQLAASVKVDYTDGTSNTVDGSDGWTSVGRNAVAVPDFTTTAEPKAPSEESVLGSSKNDMTSQDGNAKQDSVYRLYVKNLSAECKAQLDAGKPNPCVWYGYIYSTPTALTDPSGAPYVEVQKDDKATDPAKQYYVDVYIPKTVADGEHKIALTDGQGKLQGWTPVTVGEGTPAEQTAQKLYEEWGDPIVDTTLQAGRGELSNPDDYTKESLDAYKTALAGFAKKLSGVQKDALNNTDKAAAVALLAKQENLNDLYNELHNAHEQLVKYVTVYRLFNPNEKRAGSHHYTASAKERDDLVAAGWRDEGTAFVTTSKGDPVYRAYNPNDGSHFYTLNKQEFDDAVKAGWHDEGVAFHVSKDAKVPLYRLYNPNTGEHFYTTNADEAKGDVAAGWRDEGTAWNVIK
ncbi:hypothetical protein [Bifidobacterium sp. UTBIF-78]|uniref:hypothetical protein n=1 Tax=Bifidobacterium sp. UTBIF-78 TaxID=1465263 RepID=UPI00112B8402|nr:hypothetical protein [Bifidobacterium sp. UTBIF-78]